MKLIIYINSNLINKVTNILNKLIVKYIHEISKNKKIYSIKGTTLAYFKNE